MASLRTFDKSVMTALVVVFALLCGDFVLGSWRTIFDSKSALHVEQSDQILQHVDEKLSLYNINEPAYEGANKNITLDIIQTVKRGSDVLSPDFQNVIFNQTASLLKNPELPLAPIISNVRNELAELYDTLLERGFRQRHTVQSLQSDFRARSNRALLDKNTKAFEGFDKLIREFQLGVHASPMRSDYIERVDQHTTNLLSSLAQFNEIKVDRDLLNKTVAHMRTMLLDERTALSVRANSERRHLLKTMEYVRKRAYVYLAFAGLLFGTFLVGYVRLVTRKTFTFSEMKNRFLEKEKKLTQENKKINLLKNSSALILAIVKPTGEIAWSSKGFRSLFNRKSARESGWNHIKATYLTQTSDSSHVPGSYRLRKKPDIELMIKESRLEKESDFRLIIITEMKSYFSELSRSGTLRSRALAYTEKGEDLFFVDQVVEDVLLSNTDFMKNLDVSLAYEGRLPNPVKGETFPVAQTITSFLELISQGTNLFGEKIKLDLDYETKGKGLSIRFNVHNVSLDQRGITAPLGLRGRYGNVWECLTELEEKYKNYGIEVSLKNIVKKGGMEELQILQFEVNFKTLVAGIEAEIAITPSSIRARLPEVVV